MGKEPRKCCAQNIFIGSSLPVGANVVCWMFCSVHRCRLASATFSTSLSGANLMNLVHLGLVARMSTSRPTARTLCGSLALNARKMPPSRRRQEPLFNLCFFRAWCQTCSFCFFFAFTVPPLSGQACGGMLSRTPLSGSF